MKKFFQKMGSTFAIVTATFVTLAVSMATLVPSAYAFAADSGTSTSSSSTWNQNASTIAVGIIGVIFIVLLVMGAVEVAKGGDNGKKLLITALVVFLIGGIVLVAGNFSTIAGWFQPVANKAGEQAAGIGTELLG